MEKKRYFAVNTNSLVSLQEEKCIILLLPPEPPRAQQGQSFTVELLCPEHGRRRAGRRRQLQWGCTMTIPLEVPERAVAG